MNAMRSVVSSGRREYWLYRNRSAFRDNREFRRPRLLTDVSVIMKHDARTGIQRVVRSFWNRLLERSGEVFDVVPVFATTTHGYRFAKPHELLGPRKELQHGHTVSVRPGDKFLGLDLSAHLLPCYRRQIASWRAHGATTHLVVYDLLPLQHSNWFNHKTVRNFKRWIDMVRYHCDQALCISEVVANDLRTELGSGANSPSIGRIHLAGDIETSGPTSGLRPETMTLIERVQQRPTILMVGTVEPRKGYDVALAAFEHLWQAYDDEAPCLVIVGRQGWKTEKLQARIAGHFENGRRLFWLNDASDEELTLLYRACRAVFLASRGEGFGLPAIEAAHYRRWALVRHLPVFAEQDLANLRFFSNDSPGAVAQAVMEVLRNAEIAVPPKSHLPSWSSCVDRLIDEMALASRSGSAAAV